MTDVIAYDGGIMVLSMGQTIKIPTQQIISTIEKMLQAYLGIKEGKQL